MNKPFVLVGEDKWCGRFDTYDAAHAAGVATGKRWFEIIDLRDIRKLCGGAA